MVFDRSRGLLERFINIDDASGESKLVMFAQPAPRLSLDDALRSRIVAAIREALLPRFVPDHFLTAPAIPYTRSGRKQEVPIKRLFEGSALADIINPDVTLNPERLAGIRPRRSVGDRRASVRNKGRIRRD